MFAIEVDHLSKKYNPSGYHRNYLTMRDKMRNFLINPFFFVKKNRKKEFLALDDISFAIKKGEVVGIIGVNGAGKSTLLKILSGISCIDNGFVKMRGRVSSLLEIGAGFHPELTGRENVFLSGVILGMLKKEIENNFEKIVEFSGIRDFLDTPVKYYSSGMYVRLAFAVAAHMNTDILLIDEVLAVGDMSFQQKSLERIGEMTKKLGKTVLFVSHDMGAVRNLCSKCILLNSGKIELFDKVDVVVDKYLNLVSMRTAEQLRGRTDRVGSGKVFVEEIFCCHNSGSRGDVFFSGDSISIFIKYKVKVDEILDNVIFHVGINSSSGVRLVTLSNKYLNNIFHGMGPGDGLIVCRIPEIPFTPGEYFIDVVCRVNEREISDDISFVGKIIIEDGNYYKHGRNPRGEGLGFFMINHEWKKI